MDRHRGGAIILKIAEEVQKRPPKKLEKLRTRKSSGRYHYDSDQHSQEKEGSQTAGKGAELSQQTIITLQIGETNKKEIHPQ